MGTIYPNNSPTTHTKILTKMGFQKILSYVPSTKSMVFLILGRYEGDWAPTEEPENFENEENVDVDRKAFKSLEDKEWRQGKDINEQLTAIVNNRTIAYRMVDCCNDPKIAFMGMIPPLPCLYYAYAEYRILKINFFMALIKSFVMTPFLGWLWCTWPLKTVIRNQQEVEGAESIDFASFAFCFMCQPFQLLYNAWYQPEEWINEEFALVGEEWTIQECHELVDEKIHLD